MTTPKKPTQKGGPDWLARALAIFGLTVSLTSFWLSYSSSIPTLSASAELIDPIEVGKPLHFHIRIDNFGRTSARHMDAQLAYKFQRADLPIEPTYSTMPRPSHDSDLAPGAHTDLTTTNPLHLEHDHDVAFVLSGQYFIYLYGKVMYQDFFHVRHEFHFCRYYQATVPTEPNKLQLCASYNGED